MKMVNNCKECGKQNECNECNECKESLEPCGCPQKDMSTDCTVYTGDDLECSSVAKNTSLTAVIQKLDKVICSMTQGISKYLALVNIGSGAKLYKGVNNIGSKEIRTVISEDESLLEVNENEDTISILPGLHKLKLEGNTLELVVTTSSGERSLSSYDLSEIISDSFVETVTLNEETLDLTLTRSNNKEDIVLPLAPIRKHLESGTYSENKITLTLTDGSDVEVDLQSLIQEILDDLPADQVNSDYTENNASSKSFIQNKNPSKTVTLVEGEQYLVKTTDNNYIIEVDNGAGNVTVDFENITTNGLFFGIVQKGTGTVTITGVTQVPALLTNVITGQGHVCAVEVINGTKYLIGNLKFS